MIQTAANIVLFSSFTSMPNRNSQLTFRLDSKSPQSTGLSNGALRVCSNLGRAGFEALDVANLVGDVGCQLSGRQLRTLPLLATAQYSKHIISYLTWKGQMESESLPATDASALTAL